MTDRLASPRPSSGTRLDPISLEILWSRLISIVEEAETTLVRTSFSPIVGEADDHSCAIMDGQGRLLAQTPKANSGFVGIFGHTVRIMLEHFPPDTLKPGDVLITNDPWICCGHLNDTNLIRPIFYKGKLVAYATNCAHLTDIGGRASAESVDLFEEGLHILPSKLFDQGRRNETIYQFLSANSRLPVQMVGDLNAQLAATEVTERRIVELLEEYDLADMEDLAADIQERTEQVMRDAIRRLPDGDYPSEVYVDGYDQTLTLKSTVTIAGDAMVIDFAGTSAQVDQGINCPLSLTYAEVVWAVRVSLAPDLPNTYGALKPITVTAPEGCILNPRFPAAVYSRTTVVHSTVANVWLALEPLVPEYIDPGNVQANGGCLWGYRFRGQWTEQSKPEWEVHDQFVANSVSHGGQGATGVKDGWNCIPYPDNCGNVPIEVVENRGPILLLCKEIRQDSGGPGQFRGGCAQRILIRVLSDKPVLFTSGSSDKIMNAPNPMKGGMPGPTGSVKVNGEEFYPPRRWTTVKQGDVVTYEPPGGGGYGHPFDRDPRLVATDVLEGYVSQAAARRDYAVAVTDQGAIDWDETTILRQGPWPVQPMLGPA